MKTLQYRKKNEGTKNAVASVGENLVLGKKSNQQTKTMRTKTNYKPKANDRGKKNQAIFFRNVAEFRIKLMN